MNKIILANGIGLCCGFYNNCSFIAVQEVKYILEMVCFLYLR